MELEKKLGAESLEITLHLRRKAPLPLINLGFYQDTGYIILFNVFSPLTIDERTKKILEQILVTHIWKNVINIRLISVSFAIYWMNQWNVAMDFQLGENSPKR